MGKNGHSLTMEHDGNLVLRNDAGETVWETHTAGNPGAYLKV